MGCGASKVPPSGPGYGMGGAPNHSKLKQTAKRDVAILWDLDDVLLPPSRDACEQFIRGLRKVFIEDLKRKETVITVVYDGGSVLNCSSDILELHEFLHDQGVSIIESQGPAALVLGLEIQRFCSMAEPRSTLVVIGGVLDYHAPCAAARGHGLCVERVYGSQAPLRIVSASQANWHCSVADLLAELGMPDWRANSEVGPAIRFKSAIASECENPISRAKSLNEAIAAIAQQCRKPAEAAPCETIPEESAGGSLPASILPAETPAASQPGSVAAAENAVVADGVVEAVAVVEPTPSLVTAPAPAPELAPLALIDAVPPIEDAVPPTALIVPETESPSSERSSAHRLRFDAAPALHEASSSDDGAPPQRVIDPKRSMTMGQRNKVSDTEVDDIIALMDSSKADNTSKRPSADEEVVIVNEYALAPDPMLSWKAAVLRTLRNAEDGAMTVDTLAALVPVPVDGRPYTDHLQEHLIDRVLAKWVVEGESLQLVAP